MMGNARTLRRIMEGLSFRRGHCRIVELGAGDGTFMLGLAAQLSRRCASAEVVLIDRQHTASQKTLEAFQEFGWKADFIRTDAREWLSADHSGGIDLTVANLFLHHFGTEDLRALLHLVFKQTRCFLACEPRRSVTGLMASRLLWLIGGNRVTLHDAAISVRAGFMGKELTGLWPKSEAWHLGEQKAGLFGHSFAAQRDGA